MVAVTLLCYLLRCMLVPFSAQKIDSEELTVAGVSTFSKWSEDSQELMLLFHGCQNQGSDWFQLPLELLFLRTVMSKQISLLAFTTPEHNGNWCWPSEGKPLEDVLEQITSALLELLRSRKSFFHLILVGASSGGLFCDACPELLSASRSCLRPIFQGEDVIIPPDSSK